MLDQLSVKNFVVVEDLNIEFLHGMTVVTGETGAGKSILVQALNLAIGGRSDATLVRHGKSKAEIIATFSLDGNQSIQSVLEGLDLEDGNECILRRVIGSDGKSRSYVNGSNVTLSTLRDVGYHLIDMHGQNEHQLLLRADQQLLLLDGFAQLEDDKNAINSIVREYTNSLVIGNLGAVNFIKDGWNEEIIDKAVEMIDADAIAIHFNPLQEAIQPEGDVDFKGMEILRNIISSYKNSHKNIPFIAKQVGEGFSKEDAEIIDNFGFDAIDVGGSGGTSWAAVELYRIKDEEFKELAENFINWGIPTAASIFEVRSVFDKTLIATGGIRNGIDIAKSIAIGADCCGIALPILKAALKSPEEVVKVLERLIKELKIAMFLTGCDSIEKLKKAPYIVKGELKDWISQRLGKP